MKECLGQFSSYAALERCEFLLPQTPENIPGENLNMLVLLEDDFAHVFGSFMLSLLGLRVRRCLWLFGWPCRLAALFAEGDIPAATMELFRKDVIIWKEFSQLPDLTVAGNTIARRHLFNLTSNKQFIEGVEASNFQVSQDLKDVLSLRLQACIQTQTIEDMHNTQKNSAAGHGQVNFKKTRVGHGSHDHRRDSAGAALGQGSPDAKSDRQQVGPPSEGRLRFVSGDQVHGLVCHRVKKTGGPWWSPSATNASPHRGSANAPGLSVRWLMASDRRCMARCAVRCAAPDRSAEAGSGRCKP